MSKHSSDTGCLGLQLLRGALDALLPGFGGDHLRLQPAGPERECQGRETRRCRDQDPAAGETLQGAGDAHKLELSLQHLQPGLTQQQIVRVVVVEHVKHETAGGLDLPGALASSREPLKHEAGDPCDGAKLTAGDLSQVDTGKEVLSEVVDTQRRLESRLTDINWIG